MLKRQLDQELPSSEELDHLPFKELIRVGAERGLIADPQRWFDYRDKRNITSHTSTTSPNRFQILIWW